MRREKPREASPRVSSSSADALIPPPSPPSPLRAVSIRNTKNTLFKNLVDVCCSGMMFYLFGFALLHGDGNAFMGTKHFALATRAFRQTSDTLDEDALSAAAVYNVKFVYAFAFAATSSTIVSGAVAERFKFRAYALYSATITGVLYPVVAHWAWSPSGWASPLKGASVAPATSPPLFDSGFVDYAGSAVVHVTGGLAALVACWFVGPRVGRFNGRAVANMPQQSPVFQTVGTIFLWFGWYGFNCAAATSLAGGRTFLAARAALTTTISAGAGGATVILIDSYFLKDVEPRRMNNGILCGLVSISGCAAIVEPWVAVLVGIIGGGVFCASSWALLRWRVDDVVDAVPVHLFGGVWGTVATALFTSRRGYDALYDAARVAGRVETFEEGLPCGLFAGCANAGGMLASAVVFLLAQMLWVGCTTALALLAIKHLAGGLRVGLKAEMKGIDQSQHGGRSYTEFQTTVFTFKTPSGGEHSMEMRVRAGDAAKFAMALSEVMEGSTGSGSGGGSGGGRNAFGDVQAGGHAVYINDQPVDLSEMRRKASLAEEEESRRADSESGSNPPSRESSGRSRGGSGRGGGFWDSATTRHPSRGFPNVAYANHEGGGGGAGGAQQRTELTTVREHEATRNGAPFDPFADNAV